MKNEKKYYIAAWLIAVAIFHAIVFLLPAEIIDREETRFWIIYGTILASFIGQAICSFIYAGKEKKEERFLYLPVIIIGYIALLMTLLLALQALILQFLPDWFTILVAIVVFGYYALSVIRSLAAADMVVAIDKKVAQQTSFIRTLSAKANTLVQSAPAELQPLVKKVYEALRYSDPMSRGELAAIEEDIEKKYVLFAAAVKENQKETVESTGQAISSLLKERNELCRQLKR